MEDFLKKTREYCDKLQRNLWITSVRILGIHVQGFNGIFAIQIFGDISGRRCRLISKQSWKVFESNSRQILKKIPVDFLWKSMMVLPFPIP